MCSNNILCIVHSNIVPKLVILINNFSGISPEELFFAFRDQYSTLLTKVNWGLEFNDNIKFESKKSINGKYFTII